MAWNMSSIRQRLKKDAKEMTREILRIRPDVLALIEVRCQMEDLLKCNEWLQFLKETGLVVGAYHLNPNNPATRGLNGVIVLHRPTEVCTYKVGFENELDGEGRLITALFEWGTVIAPYVPSQLQPKLEFLTKLQEHINTTRKSHPTTIVCGDFNVAPEDGDADLSHIDVQRRARVSGCTWPERQRLRQLVDSCRLTDAWILTEGRRKTQGHTWRSAYPNREFAKSMRIDMALISEACAKKLIACGKTRHTMGSDHHGVILALENSEHQTPKPPRNVLASIREGVDTMERDEEARRVVEDATEAQKSRDGGEPERRPCTTIMVNGKPARALLDSGSGPTVVSRKSLRKFWPDVTIPPLDPYDKNPQYLQYAGGALEGPVPKVTLTFEVAGTPMRAEVCINNECPYDMLLSYGDMVRNNIDLIASEETARIRLKNGTYRNIELEWKDRKPILEPISMVADKDVIVPARTVLAVKAKMGPGHDWEGLKCNGVVKTQPIDDAILPDEIQIVSVRDGRTKIRVMNLTNGPRLIKKGTKLGTFKGGAPETIAVSPLLIANVQEHHINKVARQAIRNKTASKDDILTWQENAIAELRNAPENRDALRDVILGQE